MKRFFNEIKKGFERGFKEGMGISAEYDNDYGDLNQEISNPNITDEQVYIHFLAFCKKHNVGPGENQNIGVLLTRILEARPVLRDKAYRQQILDKLK